ANLKIDLLRRRDAQAVHRQDTKALGRGRADSGIEYGAHEQLGLGTVLGRGDGPVDDRHLADIGHGDFGTREGLAKHVVHGADILADADPRAIDDAAVGGGGDDRRLAIRLAEQADLAWAVDLDVRHLAVRGPDAGVVAGQ